MCYVKKSIVKGFIFKMVDGKICDICGRSEQHLFAEFGGDTDPLQRDADGLWICKSCQKKLTTRPVGEDSLDELEPALRPLVGKSAGAICRTLELEFVPPYKAIIEAASKIGYDQDQYLSAWHFVTQWQDGTTVWRSADGSEQMMVPPDETE